MHRTCGGASGAVQYKIINDRKKKVGFMSFNFIFALSVSVVVTPSFRSVRSFGVSVRF